MEPEVGEAPAGEPTGSLPGGTGGESGGGVAPNDLTPPPGQTTVMVTAPRPVGAHRFQRVDSEEPASIVLRQVGEISFELVEPFRYVGRRGTWTVTPADLASTDLASIPQFLSWFVGPYGTHTLAALLHDHLVRNGTRLEPPLLRYQADEVFREALDDLGVPWLRSRIMWAAVTFATRWRFAWYTRLALTLWLAAVVVGVCVLTWSVFSFHPRVFLMAALAPLAGSVLWGRREIRAGIVGGYTLWLVMIPALLNIVAYGIYQAVEYTLRWLRSLRPATDADELPKPPPYAAR